LRCVDVRQIRWRNVRWRHHWNIRRRRVDDVRDALAARRRVGWLRMLEHTYTGCKHIAEAEPSR